MYQSDLLPTTSFFPQDYIVIPKQHLFQNTHFRLDNYIQPEYLEIDNDDRVFFYSFLVTDGLLREDLFNVMMQVDFQEFHCGIDYKVTDYFNPELLAYLSNNQNSILYIKFND